MTLLRANGISKAFGGVQALKGVSLELRAGEVHALVGENGAGKSTLIKIITGAQQPDEGTLELAGQPVVHSDPVTARRLALLEETKSLPSGAVWDFYCLRENVPVGAAWLDEVGQYERDVLSKR